VQWTLDSFACPLFKAHRILSLGQSKAGAGYRVVRKNPDFSNLHLTVSGRGETLIQGKWQTVTAGTAVLSPQGVLHGARSLPGVPWEFCWICFAEPRGTLPRIGVPEPTLTQTDPKPLAWALLSLQRELLQSRQGTLIETLLHLIDLHVERLTAPWYVRNHLWKMWEKVAQYPAHPWTTDALAKSIHVSPRHLLRLCRKESGRSLHAQLTHIRFTRAASLLQAGHLKLQAVAEEVGYQDAFAFSKAFKRWAGVSPKAYRLGAT